MSTAWAGGRGGRTCSTRFISILVTHHTDTPFYIFPLALVSFVCSKQQIMGRIISSPVEKLTPNLVLVNVITDLMTILSRGPWHGRPEVMFRQLPYESFFHQLTQRTWGLWGGSTHKNTVGDWESQNDNIIDCNKWHFDGFLNRYLFSLSDLGDTI